VESASGATGYGDHWAHDLAQVRDALDDLRGRPVPLDAEALRRVVMAGLAEAGEPPPNLLVTAIRRLDRLDARLESIEAALGGQGALPRGEEGPRSGVVRGRAPAATPPPVSYMEPAPNPEAIAEALARRLAGVFSAQAPMGRGIGQAATIEDLIVALRPLVPGVALAVLRRAGREPSPQAVEVLQQTALGALEEAADSFRLYPASTPGLARPTDGRMFALHRPPSPLAPPPATTVVAQVAPSLDVDDLAAAIAAQVTQALAAGRHSLADEEPDEAAAAPPDPGPQAPTFDPAAFADAVVGRLARQPLPQAVVSPLAMAPLLSAVGNVEAAVARLEQPEADVVTAVDRLEAGVHALARALEDDRSIQSEEVKRGFDEVNMLVREELRRIGAAPPERDGFGSRGGEADDPVTTGEAAGNGVLPEPAAETTRTGEVDGHRPDGDTPAASPGRPAVEETLPALAAQGRRLERSLTHVLTALAALADHMNDHAAAAARSEPAELAARIDKLVAAAAADRQRFQRLGGTIAGLAELLGVVSERFNRLPHEAGTMISAVGPSRDEPGAPSPGADIPDDEPVSGHARPDLADRAASPFP